MRGRSNGGLTLYKRHGAKCEVHLTKLSESAKRFYFKCSCTIWINGCLPNGDTLPRQTTGTGDLKTAEAERAALIAENTQRAASDAMTGPSIAGCVEKYLASREQEIAERTHAQIAGFLAGFQTWCSARDARYMRDITVDLLEEFKTEGWPALADSTKKMAFDKLRCFLRDAFRRGWIKEALADRVKPLTSTTEQKQPYTDDEIKGIMFNAERIFNSGPSPRFAKSPKTFRLLLELMLATGMRVGDAVRFDPAKLTRGESAWIYVYEPQKQKRATRSRKTAEAYLSDKLAAAIRASEWITPGVLPFHFGSMTEAQHYHVCVAVRTLMKSIGKRAGILDCRPHRLRDTFAVRCLMSGMDLESVSRLLNHRSIAVTETYYAAWTRGRKQRLERLFADAIINKPSDAQRNV